MSWLLILFVLCILIGGGWWGWPMVAALFGLSSVNDKPSALANIAQLMHRYDITPADVDAAFHNPASALTEPTRRSSGDVAKTLFSYLGAIFILAGISTYIGMFWDRMGSAMRIGVTLGVGYILLIVLISALHEKKFPKLILPLSLATVFMLTSCWFVFIDEVFPHGDNWRLAVLSVFGVMALHQALLLKKYELTVLAFTALFFVYGFMQVGLDLLNIPLGFIAIILGTSLFLVATALEKNAYRVLAAPAILISVCWINAGLFDRIAIISTVNWADLLTGLCVMSTAFGLQKAARHPGLASLGYLVGSIMVFTGLFDLVYKTPFELVHIAVTASMLYACVVLQSRALLLTTVISMLSFIGYYTAQHFVDSLGWPITLVLMGVAFMGVSTLAIKVKRHL